MITTTKKNYESPQMKLKSIDCNLPIQASITTTTSDGGTVPGVTTTPADPGQPALSKELPFYNVWDDSSDGFEY